MSDYPTSVECATCTQSMFLSPGSEWPEQELYCWSCAHEQIARLTAERDEVREAAYYLFNWATDNIQEISQDKWPWLNTPAKETSDE